MKNPIVQPQDVIQLIDFRPWGLVRGIMPSGNMVIASAKNVKFQFSSTLLVNQSDVRHSACGITSSDGKSHGSDC